MTTTTAKTTLDAGGLELLAKDSPEWLRTLRHQAFADYQKLPFPTHREEAWRRTDPERVRPQEQQVLVPESRLELLGEDAMPEGITFSLLEDAAAKQPELIQKNLFSVAKRDFHAFAALNGAFWRGGTFLHLPRDRSTGETALVTRHNFGTTDGVALPHSLVVAERFSKGTLVEVFQGGDGALMAAPTVELHLEEGANLRYVFVHDWGKKTSAVPYFHARLEKDATLQLLFVGLGGSVAKVFIESDLVGEGAKSEVLGIVMARGRQHVDIDVQQAHRVGSTVSDVLFHCALTDKARTIFSGNVLCEPGSQKIDGYQQNRNLLLSEKARADSMPKLEIEANDVRCTHGATFTTYDQAQRFYLESRGLNRQEAEHLLVSGFFQSVIERVDNEPVVEYLTDELSRVMESALG